MRKALAYIFVLTLFIGGGVSALSDSVIFAQGNLTSPGTFQGLALQGQSTCSIVISGSATGFSVTVNGSSDNGATLNAVTSIGTSGVITTNGTYTGNVVAQSNGATTLFEPTLTAITGGTLHYYESCSSAIGNSGASSLYPSPAPTDANGNVKTALYSPLPLPVTIPTPTASSVPVYVSNGASTAPYPTPTVGASPTAAPVVNSQGECFSNAISGTNVSAGNMVPVRCDSAGDQYIAAFSPLIVTLGSSCEYCAIFPAAGTAPFTATTCTLVTGSYYSGIATVTDLSTGSEGAATLQFFTNSSCSANDQLLNLSGLGYGSVTNFGSYGTLATIGTGIYVRWSSTPSGSGVRIWII